jgi:catechol 2,3-dioxygenase-like lactoylglutathione lyase family enzyme
MRNIRLHHVSIIVSNLLRSSIFYENVVGLTVLQRPLFKSKGAWFGVGEQHVHINEKPAELFRDKWKFDPTSFHFALRIQDFDACVRHLQSHGYHESEQAHDPMVLIIDRQGPAGFPQAFIFDPDGNLIEFNAAK